MLGVAPLILTAMWSFWPETDYWIRPGFTLLAYQKFFTTGQYITLLKTLKVAAIVTALALVIAYPIAYFIQKIVSLKYRHILLTVFIVPFFLSYIVRVFSLRLILGTYGIINNILVALKIVPEPLPWLLFSEFAVIVGLLSSNLPFMIFPIVMSLTRVERSTLEASQDLGASFFNTFIKIILPLTKPGIFAGCIFVFIMSLGSTVEWDLLGGVGELSVSQMLVSLMSALRLPSVFAISTLILVITVGLLWLGIRYAQIDRLFESLQR
ncbi:ABC transporter permease [Candidatus Bathyarchaeota archaeon]|nr:ABC transporter permease [Candidatus Bathyarchaeota archaeon]